MIYHLSNIHGGKGLHFSTSLCTRWSIQRCYEDPGICHCCEGRSDSWNDSRCVMTFQHESSNNRCCQSYKYIGSSSTMQYHISCHTADNQLSTRQPSDADLSLGCPLNLAVTNVTPMFFPSCSHWPRRYQPMNSPHTVAGYIARCLFVLCDNSLFNI